MSDLSGRKNVKEAVLVVLKPPRRRKRREKEGLPESQKNQRGEAAETETGRGGEALQAGKEDKKEEGKESEKVRSRLNPKGPHQASGAALRGSHVSRLTHHVDEKAGAGGVNCPFQITHAGRSPPTRDK